MIRSLNRTEPDKKQQRAEGIQPKNFSGVLHQLGEFAAHGDQVSSFFRMPSYMPESVSRSAAVTHSSTL